MKTKEPIRLRQRKLKNGNISLYLDIYNKGVRSYEYLRMYLIPERTIQDRDINTQTLRLAEAVKAKRVLDLQAGRFELRAPGEEMSVQDYLTQFVENKKLTRTEGTYEVWNYFANAVSDFRLIGVPLSSVNRAWITAYSKFVKARDLSERTEMFYLQRMKMLFAQAERDALVPLSPLRSLKLHQPAPAKRVYLTLEEVRKLHATPSNNPTITRAFIFGCLTGLRYSDILRLTWGDIEAYGNTHRIVYRQKKTRHGEYLDLSPTAMSILGTPSPVTSDRVFPLLPPHSGRLHRTLRPWAKAAGLTKKISFHTSRHTFAVLMLSLGTDIYTLSKLLGHRDVSTTQIYAEILDSQKREAVMKIPKL